MLQFHKDYDQLVVGDVMEDDFSNERWVVAAVVDGIVRLDRQLLPQEYRKIPSIVPLEE